MQDAKAILLCQREFPMMSRIILNFAQIIKTPTHIPCSSTSLIDHTLAILPERISQEGAINVGLSEQQLIYRMLICNSQSPILKDFLKTSFYSAHLYNLPLNHLT